MRPASPTHVIELYERLHGALGHRHWWPADSPFEVVVGAVLTQNTSWRNVERALVGLKQALPGGLSPQGILDLSQERLVELLHPAGYYNVKAKRLRSVAYHLVERWQGRPETMAEEVAGGRTTLSAIRQELRAVHGIGEETADSILLYAAGLPSFVCDAYTRRIVARIGWLPDKASYADLQRLFVDSLPLDVALFNDYHAQIVRLGSQFCRPRDPRCDECPARPLCAYGRTAPAHRTPGPAGP